MPLHCPPVASTKSFYGAYVVRETGAVTSATETPGVLACFFCWQIGWCIVFNTSDVTEFRGEERDADLFLDYFLLDVSCDPRGQIYKNVPHVGLLSHDLDNLDPILPLWNASGYIYTL